jgi:hypothetical protein
MQKFNRTRPNEKYFSKIKRTNNYFYFFRPKFIFFEFLAVAVIVIAAVAAVVVVIVVVRFAVCDVRFLFCKFL